jgi:lysophospholipase L1-like esterase
VDGPKNADTGGASADLSWSQVTDSREVPPYRTGVAWALRLTVAGAATAVAAVLCELLARLAFPAPPPSPRQPQLTYQRHTDFGFFHVPDQAGWVEGGWATINHLGLRGVPPESPKPAGSLRVLVAGDSTTFGWGVHDHETYSAVLEQMVRRHTSNVRDSVVNAGVNTYDLGQTSRLLRHFAPRLQPDLILIGFFWNDLVHQRQTPEGQLLDGRANTEHANVARERSGPFQITGQRTGVRAHLRNSRALHASRHAWLSAIERTAWADNDVRWEVALLEGKRTPAIDQAWIEMGRQLADIRSIATKAGADVGIVIIPIRAQVERDYPQARYQAPLSEIAKAHGVFVVDPLPMFLSHRTRRDLFIPFDRMHMLPAGHELMGRAVFEAIRSRLDFAGR